MKNRGPNKRSKLLCQQCQELKQVTSVGDDIAILACGHSRTCGLLPVEAGRLSIEHLKTAAGKRLFPAVYDNEATRQLPFDEANYFAE